ncbi:MAG TPA: hypothetical protein DHV37_07855 [Erysipelotrichaceae bacterium]|uniref:hypothetical protein n=1 Tax=Sharpea azabuensis TaxID=322505 RepID=UPI000E819131|nr:hypothetical protein [Sharpea azabuensis]HAV17882.1 hypothetical protein [Erysipelotrichaceae bacterium]HBZ51199.1 hypothetical protein [Erysipelotrichaceae bacterium]HCJ38226.1 hypothetical protein [Erysipelotrichaceae bacterium]
MKILCVIEDDGGILFNHRRVSRDRILNEKILEIVGNKKLFISPFSVSLFENKDNIIVDDDYLEHAGEYDYCFVEDKEILAYKDNINMFYLFHWNRHYPSDFSLDYQPSLDMHLTDSIEFVGSSHDNILLEVFEK